MIPLKVSKRVKNCNIAISTNKHELHQIARATFVLIKLKLLIKVTLFWGNSMISR